MIVAIQVAAVEHARDPWDKTEMKALRTMSRETLSLFDESIRSRDVVAVFLKHLGGASPDVQHIASFLIFCRAIGIHNKESVADVTLELYVTELLSRSPRLGPFVWGPFSPKPHQTMSSHCRVTIQIPKASRPMLTACPFNEGPCQPFLAFFTGASVLLWDLELK